MKKILTFILIFLSFFIFQNSFANYKKLENIQSFDWFLGVENLEKISSNSQIIDIDVLDSDKKIVDKFHKNGKIVIGYINVGAIENYRVDYKNFEKLGVVGKTYPGWEDEKFLDIKNYKKFKKLILNRLDIAKQKGFDGIEPDNMDTYENFEETGFKISKTDEINYIKWLSEETHKRGMFLIQKNAPELSKDLEKYLDGALLEEGIKEDFGNKFFNYIKNKKPVFNVEYTDKINKKFFENKVCIESKKMGFISFLKNRNLDNFTVKCPVDKTIKNNISTQKINKKLDKIFIKIEKKYSKEKIKILINKVLKKISILKNNKKFKNKKSILEIIEKYFLNKKIEYLKVNFINNNSKKFLIKTNFDDGIFLKNKINDLDGVWWQNFGGKEISLNGYETNLQFIVDGNSDINIFADTKIEKSSKNKSLHLIIKKKETGDTQLPLITYTDGEEIDNLHIKYSLKFPKDLADKLGKNGWAVISEYKTTGDFRLAIYVYADQNKKLYWYMHGDNVVDEPKNYKEYWFKENFLKKVPVGKWFDVDIFWKRGIKDGEVVFKINKEKVLEYKGKTKIKDNINAIMYFTNYSSNPIDLWIDDFEVWQEEKQLKLIPKKDKIYFGAFQEFGGGETEVSKKKLENFEKLLGKKPLFAYFSQDFSEEGIKFPKKSVETIINYGEIPFIRLMPSMVYEKNKKTYNLKSIASGKFDEEFRKWAREAKKINSSLFIDFAVEANGNWFFYSNDPENFKKAYRHIIDIFREEKVNNVTWFYHANLISFPNETWNKPKNYYPGDDYIDWICFSLYGTQNPIEENIDFLEVLKENYKDILDISKNKPIALIEFGVADFNPNYKKEIWLEKTFKTIINNPYIKFSMISIWSEKWEEQDYYSDLRINSSIESLEVYKKYIGKNIFENNL